MKSLQREWFALALVFLTICAVPAAELPPPFPADPNQILERTCFQTGKAWSPQGDLRSDVAIVYGIDANLPARIANLARARLSHPRHDRRRVGAIPGLPLWPLRRRKPRGRSADGPQRPKRSATAAMSITCAPGENYGKFLCVGVQRALDAGAEAIHLEEPEFWDRAGYSEGFKREWRNYYHDDWQPPDSSVDAHWRSSKLKYFLYRRALQQVFDYVQAYNQRTGRHVRCYVPTHSLAQLRPVEHRQSRIQPRPAQRLRRLHRPSLDRHIARTQSLSRRKCVRAPLRPPSSNTAPCRISSAPPAAPSGYLNDPIEDNPNHDWTDYRNNWESTPYGFVVPAGDFKIRSRPVAGDGFLAAGIRARPERTRPTAHSAVLRHRIANRV